MCYCGAHPAVYVRVEPKTQDACRRILGRHCVFPAVFVFSSRSFVILLLV